MKMNMQTHILFDPTLPATELAKTERYGLWRQLGRCYVADRATWNAVEVEEPSPWQPAKTILEDNIGRLI